MNLENLRQSISEMSDEELAEIVKASRNNRTAPSEKKTTKRKSSGRAHAPRKKKEKGLSSLLKDIENMTPEQAAALVAQLKQKNGNPPDDPTGD